ncbi:MAG: branched-chain amino acid ABC transporter substrate-binding protein [Candidatus Eremiobacteraeota bacterium]|nr:branched-chain amino acid ABC transporter substrate-binding protein [Candidatus Eremiobacteraeota bacterium]MBC5821380.1 branched-chain amino acid ABC transporter substrate-binding protein [Candidatus Eremiobacteraeota bacterium]
MPPRVFTRVVALVALASFAGCASHSAQTTSGGSADKTIEIGIDLPVSGADASTGVPTRNGAVQAIEDANARGLPDGYTLKAYDLDDAPQGTHDPGQGAQNVRQFVSDPAVLAVIGPFNSNVGAAEIPITNDAGLVQISPATTNPGLTKGAAARKLRSSHPDVNTYFRVNATDDRVGATAAEFARTLGLSRAFVIDDDETYGKGIADIFAAVFASHGGTVLGREHLTKGQSDYKALLTKARALSPDVIFFGGTTSTGGGQLRRQMVDVGLGKLPFIGGDGIAEAAFVQAAGSAADGTYYIVAAPQTSKLPSAQRFIAAYRKRWGSDVGPYSANAYAATAIAIAAIRKALIASGGAFPSRAAVLANVRNTSGVATPLGTIRFDQNGDTTNPILTVYEVKAGKPVFVEQVSRKTS